MREMTINTDSRSEQISILKLVQKIECEEEAERKKRMTEESKMGEEAAQRLVLEMKGELKAKEVEEEEARDHAMRIEKKKRQEEKDSRIARMADFHAKQKQVNEQCQRQIENARNAAKGGKLAKKLMAEELKVVHAEWKELRKEWKKAKFVPVRIPGGVRLDIKMNDILTSDFSVDRMQNVLCVTAVASEPDVPPYLYDVVGDVKWKEIKFRCDLSFYGTNVMWLDMDVKMERTDDGMSVFVTNEGAKGGQG
eukprot:CAMPEP_0118647054 /NCGR_PEP_ID=MMETSP0785-20121206/8400_1 /TAXON_ID=91992 /ORGANISM="Bolidomonas pacifica, Strain CCMP 1866" /LENGTH=251 /DNA_ID=CAMNT_0006539119 /DNA_START=24 /DNA_END=779 /DNA_ORIENTATION=-